MSALTTDLDRILANVRRLGDFFVSGTAELRTPSLRVDGVVPIALPLLPCRCARCQQLARFLDDPETRTWAFKAAEADRNHVLETIRKAGCDVDTRTDRQGRPYSLVCTKNQAGHDRRVKQRTQDLKDLELLAP